ncbi:MAG: hypothetical protein RMJ88_11310 [Thermogemmata sp.]|nr:hypothetical protein [Thermogemmata sp.]
MSDKVRLNLEVLETREVPSGVVDVIVTNVLGMARVTIVGDAAGNNIAISRVPGPDLGRFRITASGGTSLSLISAPLGWLPVAPTSTLIVIQPPGFFGNYIEDITINMQDGNDNVTLQDLRPNFTHIFGQLTVVMGGGNDQLTIQDVEMRQLMAVLGEGNDQLTMRNVLVNQGAQIYGGSGNDNVWCLAPTPADLNVVNGNLHVDLGTGNNQFIVPSSNNPTSPNLDVNGLSVFIWSAGGKDIIRFGTPGSQNRSFDHSVLGGVTRIRAGGGNDILWFRNAIFNVLYGLLEAGNDTINHWPDNNVTVGLRALVDGGSGTDSKPATFLRSPIWTIISFP